MLTALGRYEQARALMQSLTESESDADDRVRLMPVKHVFDTLEVGGRWHPPDHPPESPAFYSTDDVTWTPMVRSPQTISMPDSVYIGLAVCSHDNKKAIETRISHVITTGDVSPSGPFIESQDIRLERPPSPQ